MILKKSLQFLLCLCFVSCAEECGSYIDYQVVNDTGDTIYLDSWAPNFPGPIYSRYWQMKEMLPNDTFFVRQVYEDDVKDNGIQIILVLRENIQSYLKEEESQNDMLEHKYDSRITVYYDELRKYHFSIPISNWYRISKSENIP